MKDHFLALRPNSIEQRVSIMWNPLIHRNTVVTSKHFLELLLATTNCQVMAKFYLGNSSRCEPKPCPGLWQDLAVQSTEFQCPGTCSDSLWSASAEGIEEKSSTSVWDVLRYFKDGLPEMAHNLQGNHVLLGPKIETKRNINPCSLEHPQWQ